VIKTAGVAFVSLQKGDPAAELDEMGWPILDWMNECEDFSETAALVVNLDLVISVDTSVAHLAGALGKPVWLLNRFESEWRWQLDREDSPWYPTMRIFRQSALNDWDGVVERVASELGRLGG
jgi:ADP-heptose:LPS heptosyltransferase